MLRPHCTFTIGDTLLALSAATVTEFGRIGELTPGRRIDVALAFEEDAYSASRGYAPWQAIVKDVRAAD